MKNFVSSIKYLYSNILYVLLFVGIPAIFGGVFLNIFKVSEFVAKYFTLTVNKFSDILKLMFDFSLSNVLNTLFASVLIIIFVSAFLGNIEYHFRSGKISLQDISSYINNNFLGVVVYYLIVFICYLLYKFILSLSIFTFHIIFSGLGNTPTIFTFILTVIVILGLFVVFALVLSYFIIALPITLSSGYSIRTSLSDANDLNTKKVFNTLISVVLPFTFIFAIVVIGAILNISMLSNLLVTFFLLSYFSVLSYTVYFDYSFIQRYDKKKRYYY